MLDCSLHSVKLPAMATTDTPSRRLLLAEDDPDLREILSELLQVSGWEVVCAADGQDAFEQVGSGLVFNAAVLDLHLPRRSGTDAAFALLRALPSARVILMTGRHDFAALPGVQLLKKPFQVQDLMKMLAV